MVDHCKCLLVVRGVGASALNTYSHFRQERKAIPQPMNTTLSVTELMQDIYDGRYDTEEMDRIANAITLRKQNEARLAVSDLKVGDIVRLVSIRPKYLAGIELPVKSRRGTFVFVDIPNSPSNGRFAGAKDVKLKPGMVELVRRANAV
jgi:hypothetical protein